MSPTDPPKKSPDPENRRSTAPVMSDLLVEERTYPPLPAFRDAATIRDPSIYRTAREDPEAFWGAFARELHWERPWDRVLEWDPPHARWFVGGRLNVSHNCLDRQIERGLGDRVAFHWEGEPGDTRSVTYRELHAEVCRFAGALRGLGVGRGDRVVIYMPMILELPVAMLACARIGAIHSVVFGGFSPESLRDRILDTGAKVVITADGGWRRGRFLALKGNADAAMAECPCVEHAVVVRRGDGEIAMQPGRDLWYADVMEGVEPVTTAESMDAEDVLYILYTSGTTGKPKGIVHTTGGYLTGVYATMKWVFDLKADDIYWCTADIGWVTGHSYIVYGPLAAGATGVMYEGAPDWPDKGRFWRLVEKYGVTIFYTAPTAIRAFIKWGTKWIDGHDLSSLRLLGTVGEPINPEAWIWYHERIGGGRCPVVDTWWQTETGMILITPLPGITTLKPGSATRPFPGIEAEVLDDDGRPVTKGGGYLAIRTPWPAMLRGIWGDPERYVSQYWSRWDRSTYFPGDGAKRDGDGDFVLLGRVDDVMNVAGHRIGTMEVESALVDHATVAEAAVVGIEHEIKGQAIAAFVTLREGVEPEPELAAGLREHVAGKIGAVARPETVIFTADLPKTRSGKIMRRLLRDIAEGKILGDTTTLADPGGVDALKERYEERDG